MSPFRFLCFSLSMLILPHLKASLVSLDDPRYHRAQAYYTNAKIRRATMQSELSMKTLSCISDSNLQVIREKMENYIRRYHIGAVEFDENVKIIVETNFEFILHEYKKRLNGMRAPCLMRN